MYNLFGSSHQFTQSHYNFLNCVKKKLPVPIFNSVIEYTSESISFSAKVIANNCIVLNPSQINLYCGKNGIDPYFTWSKNELRLAECVWDDVFVQEYKKHCDSDYLIPDEAYKRKRLYLWWHKLFEVPGN